VDVKTAYIPGFDGFAIKVSPGFFDNPEDRPALAQRPDDAPVGAHGARSGGVLDNGYLTDIRTAAAGAVAARASRAGDGGHGRRDRPGSGVQARLQMQAAHLVRPFDLRPDRHRRAGHRHRGPCAGPVSRCRHGHPGLNR
jgi:ornithine cyclodeaminase/alanine dehydrogenase-like protein (mu-crystallin family)